MSLNLSKYDLDDNPFVQAPAISMWAVDKRLNGKLFCEEIVADQLAQLMKLIKRCTKAAYVTSTSSVLGTGKSALMAQAYWKLTAQGENAIWTETTGGLSSSPTLGRIVDAMVAQGIFEGMLKKIGQVTEQRIKQLLKPYYDRPSPASIAALIKILNEDAGEQAKKFANIRRSLLIYSAMELFGYLVNLTQACGYGRPIIFIDQFEEFVGAHKGPAQMDVLGNDMNDLFRSLQNSRTTLVFSLHPAAEVVLNTAAQSYIRTFAPITNETRVTVPPMKPTDGVKLAKTYLSAYRTAGSLHSDIFPFTQDVLEYICLKTRGTPRQFISALSEAIFEGADQNFPPIDEKFITDINNHSKVLLGAPLEWTSFKKGELK